MQCFVVLLEGVCRALWFWLKVYVVLCGSVGRCVYCFVVLFEGVCSALWFCLKVYVLFCGSIGRCM